MTYQAVNILPTMLRSDLCDYDKAYIVLKGRISVTSTNNANKINKKLSRIILHLDHVYQKLIAHS